MAASEILAELLINKTSAVILNKLGKPTGLSLTAASLYRASGGTISSCCHKCLIKSK